MLRLNTKKSTNLLISIGLISIILLCSGCFRDDEVEFFRGEKRNAGKIAFLCDTFKLPVESVSENTELSILKGPKDLRFVYSRLILGIEPYLSASKKESESSDLREFFIPRKSNINTGRQADLDNSALFDRLENTSFILSAIRENSKNPGGDQVVKLYYVNHPNIEKQVGKLSDDLSRMNPQLKIERNPVPLDFNLSPGGENLRQSFSVFEPFSFHVLNSERNLAGMQFLLLLLLFLLSGFILGLWWRGRR